MGLAGNDVLPPPHRVLVTGGTGYLWRSLMPRLMARGHDVRALVRRGSEKKIAPGVTQVVGNALDVESIAAALQGVDTVVHLVGVPKPSPAKARQFREVDLVSARAMVAAIDRVAIFERPHLVYVSVAQPAPVMRAYVAVRAEAEALIRARGLAATCLRPWYVLGPEHRWPYALVPVYALMRLIPSTRAGALRLGLVTLPQMTAALAHAVENPVAGYRVLEVPEIRAVAE